MKLIYSTPVGYLPPFLSKFKNLEHFQSFQSSINSDRVFFYYNTHQDFEDRNTDYWKYLEQHSDIKLIYDLHGEPAFRRSIFEIIDSIKEYNIDAEPKIFVEPTLRNKTLYDYNVNMLRTTTEYMSAILGGADYVMPLAYDAIYHKSNPFGDRIARNQLLILKHESYFDEVLNPSDGSYYIESLTQTFAEKALAYLKNIEKNCGLIK
jgi:hypothetical protein